MPPKKKSPRAIKAARRKRMKALKKRLAIAGGIAVVAILVNWALVSFDTRLAHPFAGGQIVQVTGPDLNVREYGARGPQPAIILLEGYTTSIEFWEDVAPALAKDRLVVAIDSVGHGGSESPGNAGAFGVDGQTRSVARVIRALGLERVIVVGHSLGGGIATRLAETEPSLVSRVALVDTFSSPGEANLSPMRDVACLPVIGPAFDRFRGIRFFSHGGVSDAFATEPPDMAFRSLERMTWRAFCESGWLSEYNDEMPVAERLMDLGKPVLAVYGAKDKLTPADDNIAAFRDAGVPTTVIAASGHSPHVETPEELVRILQRFVR